MTTETSPEKLASELKLKSSSFFSLDQQERREKAGEFLQWVEDNVTNTVLQYTIVPEFQEEFELAADKAFNTPQILLTNQKEGEALSNDLVFPVEDGYTILAIDEKGIPIGYIYKPIEKLGDFNTAKVAYQKAVMLKIIEDEGKSNGLAGKANMEFAKSLGFRRHWGSALSSVKLGNYGKIYIGASGVGQNQTYNSHLLDGATPSDFTNAGLFDAYFATITAEMLESNEVPLQPKLEHDLFVEAQDRN
ncbi:MAG TPA: hypothetical protein PLV59_00220 [Candidatus Dojkabacteria bacterium]|nr:hypothetical protein [Candidatus Dojkabacteria bacterium]